MKKGARKAAKKSAAKTSKTKSKSKPPVKAKGKAKAPVKVKAKATAKTTAKRAAPKQAAGSSAKRAAPKQAAGTPLSAHAGKAMIIQILGDAEAYFFDFDRLDASKRRELIEHHLAAWDARKRAEGQTAWAESFVPVALLGESMPPTVRDRFDLSAPHAGVMLYHRGTGALLHAASKDDAKLALMAPDIETISPKASVVSEVFEPARQTYAFAVESSESDGFTRAGIEMLMQTGGAELVLV
jgi:hypothetical protein